MKSMFIKIGLAFVVTLLSISFAQANQIHYTSPQKTFILRVTAKTPGKVLPISGSFTTLANGVSSAWTLNNTQVTPFEIIEDAHFIGGVFYSTMGIKSKLYDDTIRIEILYKDKSGEHPILSGEGWTTFAFADASGNAYVTGA